MHGYLAAYLLTGALFAYWNYADYCEAFEPSGVERFSYAARLTLAWPTYLLEDWYFLRADDD